MHGTWKVTGSDSRGRGGCLVVGVVAAAVFLSWLATVLWLVAIFAAVVLVVAGGALVVLLRRNPADDVEFARQAAALRADTGQRAIEGHAVTVIHYHGGTHLHIGAGETAALVHQSMAGHPVVIAEIKEN